MASRLPDSEGRAANDGALANPSRFKFKLQGPARVTGRFTVDFDSEQYAVRFPASGRLALPAGGGFRV